MNQHATQRPKPSAQARAEAAAWIARLHGPNRSPDVEAGFRRWLAEDPERAAAFEFMTETWEKSGALRRRPFERAASRELPGFRISFSRAALAAAAIAVLAVVGTFVYLRQDGVVTGIGEQRTLALHDGTRVHLNTDTQVIERFDAHVRRVELTKGEALFEVARDPDRPFIVVAGGHQVRALGTAFVVRNEASRVAVTLVEGKVTVSSAAEARSTASPQEASRQPDTFTLEPGERLIFAGTRAPQLDQPSIEKVTAWQRGQVALDNTPLADAVAEMNRYSTTRLVIADAAAAAIRISGVFRAGDQENFAIAVSRTYHLEMRNTADEIVIAGSAGGAASLLTPTAP
jgi:transmembrane sensor